VVADVSEWLDSVNVETRTRLAMPAHGKTVMAASMNMKVTELCQYPVKTMAGEMLERAQLGPLGIEGDRVVRVEDSDGRVVTSRSHPRFLGHRGVLGPGGESLVDGRPWNAPEVTAEIVELHGKRFTIEETPCDQMKPAMFEPLLARLGEMLRAQRVLREIFGLR